MGKMSGSRGSTVCLSTKNCNVNVLIFNFEMGVCVFCQVLERGLESVLVLEDDVRFEPRFKRRMQAIMDDINKAQLDWDLM